MTLSFSIRQMVFLALALGSLAGSMLGFVSAGILVWRAGGQVDVVAQLLLAASTMVFLAGALIGWFFSRYITKPLVTVTRHAALVAGGDTSGDLPSELLRRKDEAGALAAAFRDLTNSLRAKESAVRTLTSGDLVLSFEPASPRDVLGRDLLEMADSLGAILAQVMTTAGQVKAHSEDVAALSRQISSGANVQASSLSEASAALGGVQSGAQDNAAKARSMAALTASALSQIDEFHRQMTGLSEEMEELSRQAKGIRETAKTIDDLAFQTNLLSLNANIEAARVGAAGKGFAVVAGEVRNLALRSAATVGQTGALVDSIQASVTRNAALASQLAGRAGELRATIGEVSASARDVEQEGRSQLESLGAIGEGLGTVEAVTRDNQTLATRGAGQAQLLEDQARDLTDKLGRFSLREAVLTQPRD